MSVVCLNHNQKQQVVAMRNKKMSAADIADHFGVSVRTIHRVLKEYRDYARKSAAAKKAVKTTKQKKPEVKRYQWMGNKKQISVFTDDDVFTIPASNDNFAKVLVLLQRGEYEKAIKLISTKQAVMAYTRGKIQIENSVLKYNDIIIDNSLTRRIIDAMRNDEPFDALLNFFENLMLNPSRDAVYQLFDFLTHNDIKITDDGCFIGWKRVNDDYLDFYTRSWDNSVGSVLKMDRNDVDPDPNRTCSCGFHIAAARYIPEYHGGQGRVVACKVNPRDVVAIPTDYDNAKMRVCEYMVIEDVTDKFDGKDRYTGN